MKFTLLIVCGLILTTLISCQKEFTIDGFTPDPPPAVDAVFNYDGAPGTCATAIVGGSYQAGNPLDSINRVTIVVSVTVAGNYSVTTDTVNGIHFTGTGTFSGTGPQSLVLYGSGTPIAAVDAIFTPFPQGCTFTVNTTAGNPSTPVFQAMLDGVMKSFADSAWAIWDADTLRMAGLSAAQETFQIVIKGSNPLAPGTYEEEVPGATTYVEAEHISASFELWFINLSAPTPRNNPFRVTVTGITATNVTGTFSGALFNSAGGTTELTVTNGQFNLPIQ